jgi:hypothetical protein
VLLKVRSHQKLRVVEGEDRVHSVDARQLFVARPNAELTGS